MGILAAVALATSPLKHAASSNAMRISVKSALGNGVLWGILGGYRSVIADFIWLKAYMGWEKEDLAKSVSNIELATKLDPEVIMFWNLGSSIIAYDTPHWIIDSKPHTPLQKRHVAERQAKLALEFLDRGLEAIPDSRRLRLDKALIYEKVFGDSKSALESYKKASEGNAPLFIMRDYARRLEAEGELEEALNVLRRAETYTNKKHPAYEFLAEHIKDLENKLEAKKNLLDFQGK